MRGTPEGDRSTGRCELDGVPDEIGENLEHSRRIGLHRRKIVGGVDRQSETLLARDWLQHLSRFVEQVGDGDLARSNRQPPGLDGGDAEQILNQTIRPLSRALDDAELAAARFRRTIRLHEQRSRHGDGVERIAQVVRHDAQDLFAGVDDRCASP